MYLKRCIFLLISLVTQISFGQDLIKVDDFTGESAEERVLITNVVAVANGASDGNLKFYLVRYILKDIDMFALNIISSKDLGCSGSNSNYIHFLFTMSFSKILFYFLLIVYN
jgi:hypothetical protein